ncbi:unnamed protein product [Lymnaea stagnalis]|uniref:C3H1-type domain-containing protein n=1 Tax=Lymnaea stagnalis TaxID=6523 RepID=A0AAV2I4D0_LYMST
MASLVADYSDSESEEDKTPIETSAFNETETGVINESEVKIKEEPQEVDQKKATNFFETTEDDSDEDINDKKPLTTVKSEATEKLPNPLLSQKLPSIIEATTSRIGTSVFVNPFEEAEQAKNLILEKHVKLTQAAPKKPAHQPVCWKFKKGKCHMGKNCRFFHDLENRTLEENNDSNQEINANDHGQQRQMYHPAAYTDARRRPMEQEPEDDDNYMASMKKKKRYGVSDNLMPPKKAFESLQRQREKERPWTLGDSHLH